MKPFCKHYDGIARMPGRSGCCHAGVDYGTVRVEPPIRVPNELPVVLPCYGEAAEQTADRCPLRVYPTPKEVAAERAETERTIECPYEHTPYRVTFPEGVTRVRVKCPHCGRRHWVTRLACRAPPTKRDPERIDRILGLIRERWMKDPDLRLGQMLGWVLDRQHAGDAARIKLVEDDVLEAALRKLP